MTASLLAERGRGQEGSMGTPGGHSEGCPSVLLPGPGPEKKANLLSLFSQGGGRERSEERVRRAQRECNQKGCPPVFKTDRLICSLSPANEWRGP